MASLTEVVRDHAPMDAAAREWISRLLADWQILADLSFADLVLWLPDAGGDGLWAAAHMRPTTGPTAIPEEIVGSHAPRGAEPLIEQAQRTGRIVTDPEPTWRHTVPVAPVRVEAIPVSMQGEVLGVITRNTNLQAVRTPSRLELSYLQAASELAEMIAAGLLPQEGERGDHADSPRVGDGFIRLGVEGQVEYASPNAQSVYRKLGYNGDLTEAVLADLTRDLIPAEARADESVLSAVLTGRRARDTEVGNEAATVALRSIPLAPHGESTGALVLVRDVTELRRRDRELVTKDATIREIHHRVKNNLQTVSALLRLQARRLHQPEGRAALEEAVRRVGAIAVVHEILSQSFDEVVEFDEVADQLAHLISDVGGSGGVTISRQGSIGSISSEVATPLALVLTELMQNAVEHGYPHDHDSEQVVTSSPLGITLRCERGEAGLIITVEDNGVGFSADFDLSRSASLGLSIVQTLLSEMGGRLEATPRHEGGASMKVELPLR
ncbi:MAG: sensor histidine kinase [Marmoricola sp.]